MDGQRYETVSFRESIVSVHAEIIAFLECDKRKLNIKYGVNRWQI